MKSLKCANLGNSACNFEATGETNEEVKGKMWVHATEAHPEILAGMDDVKKIEMESKMDAAIQG
ncbi:MAG: DUF1059 domain-containing protein [Candidatus Yanofskybacteria bacterium]|nr:DUF1059 domain-containing protein [Candidatus Yanofskybacteria bacterium]